MWYLSFSLWLILLSIMPSRFIHVVTNDKISFFLWLISHFICIYHIFFIHPSIVGHIGFFFGRVLGTEISGSNVVLFLNFWGNFILFSIVAASIYIPMNSACGFPSFTSSPIFFISCPDNSHSDTCEIISHYGFDLHFLSD